MSAIELCERVTVQIVSKGAPTVLTPGWKLGDLAVVCQPVPYDELKVWAIITVSRGLYSFGAAIFISCEDACAAVVEFITRGISMDAIRADVAIAREAAAVIQRNHGIVLAAVSRADGQAWLAAAKARGWLVETRP